jgi:hypothetical protein
MGYGAGPSAQPFSDSTTPPLPCGVLVVFGDESDGFLHNYLYTHSFFTNKLVKPSLSSPPRITAEEEGTSLEVGQHRELRFLGFGATGQLYEPIAQRVV